MALWRRKCGGAVILIRRADHHPPHCHILAGSYRLKVELGSWLVIKPRGAVLTPALRRCLRKYEAEMLEAWERVLIRPGDTR